MAGGWGDSGNDAVDAVDAVDADAATRRIDGRTGLLIVVGAIGLAGVAAYTYRYTQVPDDSFIFYRYARNLANGDGWVYNPGDTDGNGATSPAWTAVMAFLAWLTTDVLLAGSVMSAALMIAAAIVTGVTLHAIGRPAEALVAPVVIMLMPILASVRGMESSLMLAAMAALLHWGLVRTRPVPAGLAAGLLTLARPEGALLAVLVAVLRWRRDGRFPFVMAASGVAALVPWIVYSMATIGTPVSGTLAAKVAQERSGLIGPPFSFLRHGRQLVTTPWSLVLLIAAIAGVVVLVRSRTFHDYFVGLVGFAALHAASYGLVIRPPAYPWYYSVEYFAIAVLAAVGLVGASKAIATRAPEPRKASIRLASILLGVALVAALCYRGYRKVDWYEGYRAAGDFLRTETDPADSVGACEIGVVGWFSERPIVDYLGLLDTRSADEFRRRDLTSWFLRHEPDYYIAHVPAWTLEVPSLSTDEFVDHYEPVFETEAVPWSRLRIYRRVPADSTEGHSPLLPEAWVDRLAAAGVDLGREDRRVLGEVLGEFVASAALQAAHDGPEGVDLSGLLEATVEDPNGIGREDVATVEDLATRVDGLDLVMPLAPRSV